MNMIFKNNSFNIKLLPFVRCFFILLVTYISYVILLPLQTETSLLMKVAGMYVPIMIVLVLIIEALVDSYVCFISINKENVIIKFCKGYIFKIYNIKIKDIVSFVVKTEEVKKLYNSRRDGHISTTLESNIEILLKSGKLIKLKDTFSDYGLLYMFCDAKNLLPNFKFISSIESSDYPKLLAKLSDNETKY